MANLDPRLSIACFYNLKSSQQRLGNDHDHDNVSPMSSVQSTPILTRSNLDVVSPADTTTTYFPDEKIVMPIQAYEGIEAVPRRPSRGLEVVEHPPNYTVGGAQVNYTNADAELPAREPKPFWRRNLIWILAAILLLLIVICSVVGVIAGSRHKPKNEGSSAIIANSTSASNNTASTSKVAVTNSTLHSVASSGLFLQDGTWNMHLFSQNAAGGMTLQVSLDGESYEPYQNVSLTIPPKIGSPISATAEEDAKTGVVMINLFYLSGNSTVSNVTMSAITCPKKSANCNTISNCLLPTDIPTSVHTGLTAVNVNNAQDWRVYYLDQAGAVSQLEGNNSGFARGEAIGGTGLNASSLAAVNCNATTNNINVFYVDRLTKALFKMQFTDGEWTTPSAVSSLLIPSWNPLSGLGAAYSSSQDALRVYYTGLDLGIYEFMGSNASKTTNTSWAQTPGRNRVWAEADYVGADISAVGWNRDVRFYQMKEGSIVEGSLTNTTWTESFLETSKN